MENQDGFVFYAVTAMVCFFLLNPMHRYIPICRRSCYPYSVATNLMSYPIVLFSAIVLHWVTFNDHTGSHRSRQVSRNEESQGAPHRGPGSPSPLNAANISAVPPAHVPQTCQCGSSVPESQEDSQGTKEDTTDRCLPLYHHYGLLRRERSLEMYEPQVLPPCPNFLLLPIHLSAYSIVLQDCNKCTSPQKNPMISNTEACPC